MNPLRRHVSVYHDKQSALRHFHKEVVKLTDSLRGHTFFEIVCSAPDVLEVNDIENYATDWIDKGWSADVVTTNYRNGRHSLNLRLRSYIDSMPY